MHTIDQTLPTTPKSYVVNSLCLTSAPMRSSNDWLGTWPARLDWSTNALFIISQLGSIFMSTQTLQAAKLLDTAPLVAWLFTEVIQLSTALRHKPLCVYRLVKLSCVGLVMVWNKLLVYNLLHATEA